MENRSTMRRRGLRIASLWLALGGGQELAAAAQAGEVYGAFLDRVEVEVVNVDVVVTDAKGRPVLDLGRDELELRVDGKPVELAYFAAPTGVVAPPTEGGAPAGAELAAAPGAAASDATAAPDPPPTLIVYVDGSTLQPARRNEALRGIRDFLSSPEAPQGRVLVAAFDNGLRLLTDATDDRAAVLAALAQIERTVPAGMVSRSEEEFLLRDMERAQNRDSGGESGGINARDEAARYAGAVEAQARSEAERQRISTQALAGLLSMLDGIEGRKLVLHAGGGFRNRPAARLADVWTGRFGHLGVDGPDAGRGIDPDAVGLTSEFARLVKAAQSARVTIFTVDGSDTSAPTANQGFAADTVMSTAGFAADLEARGNLSVLSHATGGRTLRSGPGLGERLAVLSDDLASSYSLGFSVDETVAVGFHRIEVIARRPGLRVMHREGFRRRAGAERSGDLVLAGAAFGAVDNPLGVTVEAGAVKGSGRGARVPIAIRVPLRSIALIPEGERQVGRLAFHFALRTRDDRLVQLESRVQPLSVANAQLAAALAQHVTMDVDLPLPPGTHRLAVGVHDEIGDGRSTAVLSVVVPGRP